MSRRTIRSVVVVAGGDHTGVTVDAVPDHDWVIAADSGLLAAVALDLKVDLAVGDFDSLDQVALADFEASGGTVARFPAAKDSTDLDLALDAALEQKPQRITVLGGAGGRLDHLLANALVLSHERFADIEMRALMGRATVMAIRDRATLRGARGDLVSLLAVNGEAKGVTTSGLLYPLTDATLTPASTLGVSNEMTGSAAGVRVTGGVLLAVQPGEKGTHVTLASPPSA